jgi:hypothetical protein
MSIAYGENELEPDADSLYYTTPRANAVYILLWWRQQLKEIYALL